MEKLSSQHQQVLPDFATMTASQWTAEYLEDCERYLVECELALSLARSRSQALPNSRIKAAFVENALERMEEEVKRKRNALMTVGMEG